MLRTTLALAWSRIGAGLLAALLVLGTVRSLLGSDHLDTPTIIADPAADIGDLFAWTSADGRRLNLVMDIVAHRFSDRLQYVFHVESGQRFGHTTAATLIACRFDVANDVECWLGDDDHVRGDASTSAGLDGERRRMRVFAGLRDDPFFNNVKGTRAMYQVAINALQQGAQVDGAGCPRFDSATSRAIHDTWQQTDGAPGTNFLAGWQSSSLVISVDLDVVNSGGNLLAVWGAVHKVPQVVPAWGTTPAMPRLGEQIQRTGRPLIKNALVGGPLTSGDENNKHKEDYNRVKRGDWTRFQSDIQRSLAFYDGLDGNCGNQWLADPDTIPSPRYERLAELLVDDRIWVNSKSAVCTQFLAVELSAFNTPGALSGDCGGRTPNYDASNILRSLLTNGAMRGMDDGLSHDDKEHSTTAFPFLSAP